MNSRDCQPASPQDREEINPISHEKVQYGYQRFDVMLERLGIVMTKRILYRIYRAEVLSVPLTANQNGSLDVVSKIFKACRKLRILAVQAYCGGTNLSQISGTSILVHAWHAS